MGYKVVQYGCGPIGCSIVRLALTKANIKVLGAIDLENTGKDLGIVAGIKSTLGVLISNDTDAVLNKTKPDIVLHATGSSLEGIFPQLETIMKAGINVISTSEELSYPYRKQPEMAAKIEKLAQAHGVTVLGTGVNPGFLMDAWPLFMTAVCQDIKQIRVVRVQDASHRRIPFQKKIGAGTTVEEFKALVASGSLRHVGLPESIAMIAAGMGWSLEDITETIEPIIAEVELRSDFVIVKPGQAAGVKQVGHGRGNGSELITLDFQAYIGAEKSYDAVYIKGIPDIEVVVKGGVHGDLATAAMVINSIPRVIASPPGLITMKDLPLVNALTGTE